MILIDPELKPDSPPKPVSARRSAAARSATLLRLPSARTLAQFLTKAQEAVRLRGQVTVLLTSDAAMRDLNRRFRGKNKATDVLSFPAERLVRGTERVAGDLAISVETARRQSAEQGHSLGTELKVLMLHGLLHLAGYDHEMDAGEMERREGGLRARLGLPLGLIERTGSESARQRAGRPALSQRTPANGARTRKATADPSTSAARAASAQDDRAKRPHHPRVKRASSRRRKP